jgi:hypothetical protein
MRNAKNGQNMQAQSHDDKQKQPSNGKMLMALMRKRMATIRMAAKSLY